MGDLERSPSEIEGAIFDALMAPDFPGRDAIRDCLKHSKVTVIDKYGSLKLHSTGYPKAVTISDIPVEGRVMDTDNIPIYILLHAPSGMPEELEIYKADGSEILEKARLLNLEVHTYPPGG